MSRDFIKRGVNSDFLAEAVRQQKELQYLIESNTQQQVSQEYISAWINRNETTSPDFFLNYLKSILRTDNFMTAFNQLRYPLPSSQIVNDKIKKELLRVFHAEDAFFNYHIRNERVNSPSELNSQDFNREVFNAILFRFNDIVVTDMEGINLPRRMIIDIESVKSIESYNNVIYKIGFTSQLDRKAGYTYIDDKMFAFYPEKEESGGIEVAHDLGRCPVDYLVNDRFTTSDVVKKSLFTYIKPDLEEYNILRTFRKVMDVNGTFPVVTVLDSEDANTDLSNLKGSSDKQPITQGIEGSMPLSSGIQESKTKKGSLIQAGTEIKIPPQMGGDMKIDSDIVQNYIKFFYAPVDVLKHIDERIESVKKHIIASVLGDYSEEDESAKNELQVNKGYTSKEDSLRQVSELISRPVQRTEYNFLSLMYGPNNVSVDLNFGSDFFLMSTSTVFDLVQKSPNPIESMEQLIRASGGQKRVNSQEYKRKKILYHILPYVNKEDFNLSVSNNQVDDVVFQLQTRFPYWVSMFESTYGNIVDFWEGSDATTSEKTVEINNFLTRIIQQNVRKKENIGTEAVSED